MRLEWFDLDTDDLTAIEEVLGSHEGNVVIAVNRRVEGRPVKNSGKRPRHELPPLETCPVCSKVFRRKRANYICCSYTCSIIAKQKKLMLPDWVWIQAGGVPSWAYTDGIAPHMNIERRADNLAWEYHRLIDRDE
jgi:hypothetical protein